MKLRSASLFILLGLTASAPVIFAQNTDARNPCNGTTDEDIHRCLEKIMTRARRLSSGAMAFKDASESDQTAFDLDVAGNMLEGIEYTIKQRDRMVLDAGLEIGDANIGSFVNPISYRPRHVAALVRNGPASLAGIKIWDEIVQVGRTAVDSLPNEEISKLIQEAPSPVNIWVLRQGHALGFDLKKRPMDTPPASFYDENAPKLAAFKKQLEALKTEAASSSKDIHALHANASGLFRQVSQFQDKVDKRFASYSIERRDVMY